MTQVNLLPPGLRQRQRTRQLTIAVLFGAAALIALLLVFFVFQSMRLSKANQDLADQQRVNSGLQAQIGSLAQFQQLKQQVTDKEALVNSILQGQILWSGVLEDVSKVIPSNMYLTQLSGTLSQATAGATPGTTGGLVGSITFNGVSLDKPTLADWLSRLEEVKGWVNSWISTATESASTTGTPTINFSGTIDLTPDATTPPRPLS